MTTELIFDYETRGIVDLFEVGLDRYSKHESTQILMCAYQFDNRKPRQFFPHEGLPPEEFIEGLKDPHVTKIAHNASFEREVTFTKLGIWVPFEQWKDSIVPAHILSLPGYLEKIGEILHFAPEHCKDPKGEELVQFFCQPVRLAGLFGMEFRDWESHPKEWDEFAAYNRQDLRAEKYFWDRFKEVVPEVEWRGWWLDQKINRAGMPVNVTMARKALKLALRSKDELVRRLQGMTGLENPLSDQQMGDWVRKRGYPYNSMRKEIIQSVLDHPKNINSAGEMVTLSDEASAALKIRQQAKKTSYTKIERMLQVVSEDDCLRYQFRYGAAARTLRWAGGDIQTQNIPRHTKEVEKNFQRAINLIMAEDYNTIQKEHPSVIGMVVGSLRLMFQVP